MQDQYGEEEKLLVHRNSCITIEENDISDLRSSHQQKLSPCGCGHSLVPWRMPVQLSGMHGVEVKGT